MKSRTMAQKNQVSVHNTYSGGQKYEDNEKQRKSKPPIVATVPCEIFDANRLPPTTATDVQMVCPSVAPTATPIAFLWVASCRIKKQTGIRN